MNDTPQNTPRDNATGPASTGATASGDLSGISEMFGLRDGQQVDTGTRTGTDTVGRWVAAMEGVDQPPDVSSRLVHGRYRLIAELGVGGMGVTYRAWDTKAGIPVVVKMPRREVRSDSEAMQRFAREIDAMLAVAQDNIVPITDHGDDDGCPFVVMRFLPGGSLADDRRRDEAGNAIRNPPGMLHFWLPGVAAALDHIHARGMLHRGRNRDGSGLSFAGNSPPSPEMQQKTPGRESVTNRDQALVIRSRPQFLPVGIYSTILVWNCFGNPSPLGTPPASGIGSRSGSGWPRRSRNTCRRALVCGCTGR